MSTVRAQEQKDLIYKRGQAGITKASVTITFDNSDKEHAPPLYKEPHKISVTRQISIGNTTAKYLVNGHRATKEQIASLFQSVQLNINNPNFLIMQGKITKMLNMKPTEILNLIEEAAGTKGYESQKEKSARLMAKKNKKLQLTEMLLREEVQPKLELLKEQVKVVVEFNNAVTQLEKLEKAYAAHVYKNLLEQQAEGTEEYNAREAALQETIDNISNLKKEITNLQTDLEEMKRQKADNAANSHKFKTMEESETKITNEITRLTTARDLKIRTQKEETEKRKSTLYSKAN
ncbi:unnamed protein product [Ambrosiozyma monospora]|uniref:Unnamed protein product n=1 Tax=Ambrosiozyma monospora TaxID=43982 RepID=A0ACB5U6E2_AMBMO|nr:unnamed protein product [Ambrosiozyma monospora]